MPKFNYFAYGSNMLAERITARCPSAVCVGRAEVPDFRIEFSKPSIDNSGKATLVRSVDGDQRAYGVVFEIDQTDKRKLDRFEGAGRGYDIDDSFSVHLAEDGATVKTRTYLATETRPDIIPYDWYLALVIAGAVRNQLERDYVARLRRVHYEVDTDSDRKTRKLAEAALRRAGIADYRELLSQTER